MLEDLAVVKKMDEAPPRSPAKLERSGRKKSISGGLSFVTASLVGRAFAFLAGTIATGGVFYGAYFIITSFIK